LRYDLQSSLTIANALSSHYTLFDGDELYVDFFPFILAYIIYGWLLLDGQQLTEDDDATEKY